MVEENYGTWLAPLGNLMLRHYKPSQIITILAFLTESAACTAIPRLATTWSPLMLGMSYTELMSGLSFGKVITEISTEL